ncbi:MULTISPECIES: polysaccharide biosynthesis/export family protein [Dickeya]|uniref:polysaccharide biosynthesis/export family protein n=1 Tax=Dickeya TaxID=204037 RepID=UPI0014400DC1|nr:MULTISPECIES: polysaccharide biosynthesis/export family protein [Dickeya]MCO7255418.1 polysaccharide export protein [Dickeya oryzae]QIZ45877.1 polysaccharide export protein [Dickeya zeae]UUE10508.1 polysaccharide export protein [Dickeya zeae]
MRIIKLGIFLCLSMLLAGCSLSSPQQQEQPDDEESGYLLDEGDAVNILVYGEPEMTMKFMLDKSGAITFPYIGPLVLKGKTPGQVSDELTKRLRGDYLQNPMVTVSIAEFRKFYITGEVVKPNGYTYEPGLNVEKALALAGGFTDRADRKDLAIRLSKSHQLIEHVDIRHAVHPGDTVIVGMSFF